ncbi:hypothetical protein ABIB56_000306 [Glaciihabitans sp. UYNi722]
MWILDPWADAIFSQFIARVICPAALAYADHVGVALDD